MVQRRKSGKWPWLVLLAGLLLFQTACATTAAPKAEKHWGYAGDVGPEYWYELDPAYAIARDGKAQSPINIITADIVAGEGVSKPEFHYAGTEFEVENNGHTIEIVPAVFENYIIIDNDTYVLQQAHFHAPSEHLIDGKAADAELHLVHKSAQGNIAVVGIFIVRGQENTILHELFSKLPQEVTSEETLVPLEEALNLADLLAADDAIYRYDGSLTTPPCSEGVKWSVASRPIELSAGQISAFTAIYDGNSRPVQNVFGRKVYLAK